MLEDLEVLERKEIVTLEKWEQQQNQFYANISYIGVNLHEHMEQVHIILHNMYTLLTPLSFLGLVNMKSKAESMLAIFIAAL